MANWRLYTMDAASFRYSDATASHNANQAPYLVAVNPASLWGPGTSISPRVGIDLGAATNLVGVGISGHNVGGLDLEVWKGNTLLAMDTLIETKTLPGTPSPSANSPDAIVTFASTSIRYLTVRINAALVDTDHVGAICALTADGLVEFEDKSSALFGGQGVLPGYAELDTGGGVRLRQVTGSTQRLFQLSFPGVSIEEGETGHTIIDLYERTNGFADGIWLTNYDFGEATANLGVGYYCSLAPGTDLAYPSGPVSQQSTIQLTLQELSRGAQ